MFIKNVKIDLYEIRTRINVIQDPAKATSTNRPFTSCFFNHPRLNNRILCTSKSPVKAGSTRFINHKVRLAKIIF